MDQRLLTNEVMARYRQTARLREEARRAHLDHRRRRARELARAAARLLKEDFGARRVLLFGSLARGDGFHERSDIDLAVQGLPPTSFFAAWRAIDELAQDIEIQLVDLDLAPTLLRLRIEETRGAVIGRYLALSRRITDELDLLERTVSSARRHWQLASAATEQEAYLNSVALNLHAFYSGLERLFELVAEEFDGGVLGGENWHAELLRQMTLDMDDVRPPVLRRETAEGLEDLRKFRHLIRNIYATNVDPERMAPLVDHLDGLWGRAREDLETFSFFLEQLAAS